MGKGSSLFSGISMFLDAVKSGGPGLSPAMAKQDTLYSIIAWPHCLLVLEQRCAFFFL